MARLMGKREPTAGFLTRAEQVFLQYNGEARVYSLRHFSTVQYPQRGYAITGKAIFVEIFLCVSRINNRAFQNDRHKPVNVDGIYVLCISAEKLSDEFVAQFIRFGAGNIVGHGGFLPSLL